MSSPVYPDININGTSIEELIKLNTAKLRTLQNALTSVRDAAPHGRDYFFADTYNDARNQHDDIYSAIDLEIRNTQSILEYLVDKL